VPGTDPTGYAVTGFVLDQWPRTKPGGSLGARTRRRQRFVVQGSSEGGDHEPLADGGETPRPQGAS